LKKEKVSGYSGGGVPFAPSMIVGDDGVHVFYLDNRGASSSGVAYEEMKLCYTHSRDFGVTWSPETVISSTPAGATAWAHSEVIDSKGVIHAIWNDNRPPGAGWKVCYQKSSDGGKTWLSDDMVIVNRDGTKVVYDYKYKNGSLKDWICWGSDYVNRIDCSINNIIQTAYCVKAANAISIESDQILNMMHSRDGGMIWQESDNKAFVNYPITYYQGGYFFDNRGTLFSTFFSSNAGGEGGTITGVKSNIDGSGSGLLSGINGFSYSPVILCLPPVFNREKTMLFIMKSFHYVAGKSSLDYIVSKVYPYGVFNERVLDKQYWSENDLTDVSKIDALGKRSAMTAINPEALYKSQISDNKCYIFSGTACDSTITSTDIAGRVFMTFSRDSGITRSAPIFIDYRYGDYDSMTSAEYGSTVYILKKSPDTTTDSNFYMSSFPKELLFACSDNELMTVNPDTLPLNNFERNDLGEKINCFTGDDEGNMLYGTSSGLYIRNINHPNAIIDKGGGEDVNGHLAVNFPVKVSKYEKFPEEAQKSFGWQKFFDKIKVTSVYAEKGGIYWVGTADRGIFRTTDRGANWTHIESKMSNLVDISYISKGSASKINKLNIFSRRFNVRDVDDKSSIVSELILNTYNLLSGVVESSTVIARDKLIQGNSLKTEDSSVAACSNDGSYVAYFDAASKKLMMKKKDRSYNHFVQKVLMEFTNTGVTASTGDSVEVFAGGMLMTFVDIWKTYFTPGPVFYPASAENDYYACKLEMKIGELTVPCFQHSFADVATTGEIYYRIKSNNNLAQANTGRDASTVASDAGHNGYFMVKTIIRSQPFEVARLGASITKLVFAPDDKTLYAVNSSVNKVYEIKNFDSPGGAIVREYSKNIANPVNVIFSHPTKSGSYKTYIVCSGSIVDTAGSKFFDDGQTYNIKDAAVDLADNVIFIDGISKKIFKCSRTAEKTVYITVSENDQSIAGSMPPLTVCKKFYSGDIQGNTLSSRDFIKYEYVYSSQKYPDGILSNEQFSHEKYGDNKVLMIYVIDNQLKVKAPLEISPGTIIKFATADKQVYSGNYSGRSVSGIKVEKGGKLFVMGNSNEDEHVIFTSIDDNSVPPSIYNASDGDYKSAEGLPNTQLRRTKSNPANSLDYKNSGGPLYGDWGVSDGKEDGSFGGIYVTDNSDMNINYLDLKYGLFYTGSLYPDGTMPRNFSTRVGISEWKRTNVFVVKDVGTKKFEIMDNTIFKVNQGAIVKVATGSSINLNTISEQAPPHYSLIIDGSPRYPVFWGHVSLAGIEGRTPNEGFGYWKGLFANGSGEVCVLRGAHFISFENIKLINKSNICFNGCEFGNRNFENSNNYNISSSAFNSGDFYNSVFNIKSPGNISAAIDSSLKISGCKFYLLFNDGDGGPNSSFIRTSDSSIISMDRNYLKNVPIDENPQSFFNGPKLKLESTGYITNNIFESSEGLSSVEVLVISTLDNEVWPVLSGNEFKTFRTALSFQGYEGKNGMLAGKIVNNDFSKAARIMKFEPFGTDNSFYGFLEPSSLLGINNGNMLIGDKLNKCIYNYSPNGDLIGKTGGYGTTSFYIGDLTAIASNNSGEIYIADSVLKKIKKISPDGIEIMEFGKEGADLGQFQKLSSIGVLSTETSEMLFVSDSGRNKLMRFDSGGNFIDELGGFGREPEQFDGIAGLAISKSGTIYAADPGNNRIQKIVLGSGGSVGEHFEITTKSYSTSARENKETGDMMGFSASKSAPEGEYIQLMIYAMDSLGKIKTSYASSGVITIAETGGTVAWEGPGITGNGNAARYDSSAFFSGVAIFYIRASNACSERTITITDASNPNMKGSAVISWTPESPLPGAVYVGVNNCGFRRYCAVSDPGVKLIKIPASNFERGDSSLGITQAEVKMSSYYISETPVTNRQFKKWRDVASSTNITGGWKWQEKDAGGTAASNYPDHPAVWVSWADARNYSYWLMSGGTAEQDDRFLLSEAQYEKACRGPMLAGVDNGAIKKAYPWGLSFDQKNCNEGVFKSASERPLNGSLGTTNVFEYSPQGYYGLYDMAGNVYSWCRDGYSSVYQGLRVDPLNYSQSEKRIVRGGSFDESDPDRFRCSCRNSALSAGSYKNIGFRVGYKK